MTNIGYPLQGSATATLAPLTENKTTQVKVTVCDPKVPTASKSIIGRCQYYYKPLHEEFVEKTGVATRSFPSALWSDIKQWALQWNPWSGTEKETNTALLSKRDELLLAEASDSDWSRHANFMMRHIGCGHTPPPYYVSYGYYYCSRYGKYLEPKLSTKGINWLKAGRELLQINMELGLDQNMQGNDIHIPCRRYPNQDVDISVPKHTLELSHDMFKKFAFDTHVPAYLDAGLADLSLKDLWWIGTQPNIEEWADGDTWSQAGSSALEVSKDWAQQGYEQSKQAASDAVEAITDALERALKQLEALKFGQ